MPDDSATPGRSQIPGANHAGIMSFRANVLSSILASLVRLLFFSLYLSITTRERATDHLCSLREGRRLSHHDVSWISVEVKRVKVRVSISAEEQSSNLERSLIKIVCLIERVFFCKRFFNLLRAGTTRHENFLSQNCNIFSVLSAI